MVPSSKNSERRFQSALKLTPGLRSLDGGQEFPSSSCQSPTDTLGDRKTRNRLMAYSWFFDLWALETSANVQKGRLRNRKLQGSPEAISSAFSTAALMPPAPGVRTICAP